MKEDGSIVRQNGAISSIDHTTNSGDYTIHTTVDVSQCVYLATTANTADGTAGFTRAYLGGNSTTIIVETFFTHTAQEDMAFNLGVDC